VYRVLDLIWAPPRERAPQPLIDALPHVAPLVVHLAAWRLRTAAGTLGAPYGSDAGWPDAAAVQDFLFTAPFADLPACHIPRLADAAARLVLAVQRGEMVGVYGDYDVDGMASAALLTTWLAGLGLVVETVLPNRQTDGYGLSNRALERMAALGCRLVVAVDCGVTAVAEAIRARQLGLELIVLDHHAPGPIVPDVALLVDPKLPGGDTVDHCLAAAGLAYRLCEAMVHAGVGDQSALDQLVDLAALGAIADVCPLTGQNRQLAARGLTAMRRALRPGLAALAAVAGVRQALLGAADVAYRFAPRLNAAGRLGDPRLAYELLVTADAGRAASLAAALDGLNRRRQTLTEAALQAALAQLGVVNGTPKLLIAAGADWHPGIVGLLAAKLSERYHRPAIALTATDQGYTGSARSIDGFDLAEALHACRDLLLNGGGHARAAGLTLETAALTPLRERLEALAEAQLSPEQLRPQLAADASIRLKSLTSDLLRTIELLGPFGEGNRPPLLQAACLGVVGVNRVGRAGQHVQFRFAQGGVVRKGVLFNADSEAMPSVGSCVDVLFTPQLDVYGGAERVELQVAAMRAAKGPGD
jgi:single-stranded-DNA-specific exonuclease